jgi:tripartite-type tricarboxylate transporter receptor subunit TctC
MPFLKPKFSKTALIALMLTMGAPTAQAQDAVAAFYKGKSVTLVIPSTPGGGYDLYGRLVARHIGRFIPGNPNVNPSNMSGAAGVVAAQYVYAAGNKDGTVLGETYPNALMEPVVGDKGKVKYDSLKFNYIGSANTEAFICYVGGKSGVNSFADAFDREVILGATGVGGPSTDFPTMYNNLLGTKFKVVNGYPGITEIGLAIEKNEVQGTCGSAWATMTTGHPDWLPTGVMKLIAEENLKPHPDIAKLNVPLTPSFAKTPEAKQVFDFVFSQATFGRPFMMAPEVPADRVAAVRTAFATMVKDPEFLADAARAKMEITDPMNGEQLAAAVARLLATPPDVIERVKQAIVPKKS